MAEKKTIEQLVNELWWMASVGGGAFGVSDSFTQEQIKNKRREIEQFHYDELQRVEDACTPATRADLRRERGAW